MTTINITKLSITQIQSLSFAQVAALTSALLSATDAGGKLLLNYLLAKQVSGLNMAVMTSAQLQGLIPAQVAGLTSAQLSAKDAGGKLVLTDLLPRQVSGLNMAVMTAAQLQALIPAQVAGLTSAQLSAKDACGKLVLSELLSTQVQALSLDQVGALTANQLSVIDASNHTILSELLPTQIGELNLNELSNLGIVAQSLNTTQAEALLYQGKLLPNIIANLTESTIYGMKPSDFKFFSEFQINALGSNAHGLTSNDLSETNLDSTLLKSFSQKGISSLDTSVISSFSTTQISQFTPIQIAYLTSNQINALGANASGLTPEQIKSLLPASIQNFSAVGFANLKPEVISALSVDQVAGISASETHAMTIAQIKAFNANASGLTINAINGFTVAQLDQLSPDAISHLNFLVITNLTPNQIAGLAGVELVILGNAIKSASNWWDWTYTAGQKILNFGNSMKSNAEANYYTAEIINNAISSYGPKALAAAIIVGKSFAGPTLWKALDNAFPNGELANNVVQSNSFSGTELVRLFEFTPHDLRKLSQAQIASYLSDNKGDNLRSLTKIQVDNFNSNYLLGALEQQSGNNLMTLSPNTLNIIKTKIPDLINQLKHPDQEFNRELSLLTKNLQDSFAALDAKNAINPYMDLLADSNTLCVTPTAGQITKLDSFVHWYDANFTAIKNTLTTDSLLHSTYSHVATRLALSTSTPISYGSLVTDVKLMFNNLSLEYNVLTPSVPPATGTDVRGYIQTIAQSLLNETGKFNLLKQNLKEISNDIESINKYVIDDTTQTHLDPSAIMWMLNGAPLTTQSNITYNGANNLSFKEAIIMAEIDLFKEANTFVVNCAKGIDQVVANKTFADEQQLIQNVLDIVGGVLSLGAGLGKTYAAFQNVSGVINAVKAGSEVLSDLNIATSITKSEIKDWMKAEKSAVSNTLQYNHIADAFLQLPDLLHQLGVPADSNLSQIQQEFTNNFKSLIVSMASAMKKGGDTLIDKTWSQTMSIEDLHNYGPPMRWYGSEKVVDFYGHTNTLFHDEIFNVDGKYVGFGKDGEVFVPGYIYAKESISHDVKYNFFAGNVTIIDRLLVTGHNII